MRWGIGLKVLLDLLLFKELILPLSGLSNQILCIFVAKGARLLWLAGGGVVCSNDPVQLRVRSVSVQSNPLLLYKMALQWFWVSVFNPN